MDEINRIISTLRKTFEKNAWHGPAVKEVLQDITTETATRKLPNVHSIVELVAHMTAWRIFVIQKLQGNETYKVTDEMNFPHGNEWTAVLQQLDASQHDLLKTIETFPADTLKELVPHGEHKYTFYTLLHGIIHHDLYHIGQIALLKKL